MLSDSQIRNAVHWGDIGIAGYTEDRLQPSSYDVTLHPVIRVLDQVPAGPLDPKVDTSDQFYRVEIPEDGFILRFGQLVLASTAERITLGRHVARVEGKSSLGRLGLAVHVTAGYIDPGFDGQVTLELFCPHPRGVKLYPGMPIGQVAFDCCPAVDKPYEGKYLHQEGPTASRYHLNWTGTRWK